MNFKKQKDLDINSFLIKKYKKIQNYYHFNHLIDKKKALIYVVLLVKEV